MSHHDISMRVNGNTIKASVEARESLADFLRDKVFLTGIHLGCEHGICGACTILINGSPARSCIARAVSCDSEEVATVEGFSDDLCMEQLREAFSKEHALQCGFCTSGMLITAYDIVKRIPDADENRIRLELSGNLCRCTGYGGIVRAIRSVLATRSDRL